MCWRWKRKILAVWGQYRSFYGALEHTGNINLLTFHLQTLGKPHSHKFPPLHSSHIWQQWENKTLTITGWRKLRWRSDQLGKDIRQLLCWSFPIVLPELLTRGKVAPSAPSWLMLIKMSEIKCFDGLHLNWLSVDSCDFTLGQTPTCSTQKSHSCSSCCLCCYWCINTSQIIDNLIDIE